MQIGNTQKECKILQNIVKCLLETISSHIFDYLFERLVKCLVLFCYFEYGV